jgi:uncharacterized protein (UPF0210 family)
MPDPVSTPVIRTLTLGIADRHPISAGRIKEAAAQLRQAELAGQLAGYRIQTVRISSRPVFDDMTANYAQIQCYGRRLQAQLDDLGVGHFSLGVAEAARPGFPLGQLAVISDLLTEFDSLSCAVQVAGPEHGVSAAAALSAARIMTRIAGQTPDCAGNFRFAALACVGPGHPFFPASYHAGPDSLAIGLQGASIVAAALAGAEVHLAQVSELVRARMLEMAGPVARLGQRLASDLGVQFRGIDLSPAPSPEASIGAALSVVLPAGFGGPGTLAAVAAVTAALRTTGLPTCGYNGVMLPVLEDTVLAQAWSKGQLTVHQLLAYSAICGTGLDTIPLDGDTTEADISGLITDVAALAVRLHKPLSARLFPLPGTGPGDRAAFASPYLIDIELPKHGLRGGV